MAKAKEKLEASEEPENVGSGDSDRSGTDTGSESGAGSEPGADSRAVGSGNGASDRGSPGGDGDGGSGSGDGGDSQGSVLGDDGPVGGVEAGLESASGDGDGVAVRRGRGRPRGSRSNRNSGDRAGAGSRGPKRENGLFGTLGEDPALGPEPKKVDARDLGGEDDYSKFTKSEKVKVFAQVLEGFFKIPGGLLKQPHWELTPKEATDLAKAVLDVADTLPAKQTKKIEKLLKEYAPYISLLTVGFSIFYPRVMFTYAARSGFTINNSGGDGSGSKADTGASGAKPNSNGDQVGGFANGSGHEAYVQSYFGDLFPEN